jgi:integrative and conjugative element protein (TIGR02256 family)
MPADLIAHDLMSPSGSILIEGDVLTSIFAFRQLDPNVPESGGILLGFRRGPHIHVTAATTPQPGDAQSRYRFHRAESRHQRFAYTHWASSNETGDYLGEWHTHPEPTPTPSGIDRAEWQKICNERKVPMLFVILGTSSPVWLGIGLPKSINGRLFRTSR